MKPAYIIAIDQGTSGVRALAVDAGGAVYAQARRVFSPRRTRQGSSEYDGVALLRAQQEVLHELLDRVGPQQVAALAVCSQRSSVVLWDKQTGDILAPVLTWEDGRAHDESESAPLTQEQVHAQTGLFKTPYFSAPKIAWCLRHIPAVAQAAGQGTLCAAPIASHLIWHLTRGAVFATDPTLAQRTLLWDIRRGNWSEELCRAFGVPLACLPALRPSVAVYGSYKYAGVSIPILCCVADQQASAAYQELSGGKTHINYGTGAFVLHHTAGNLVILPGMLSSVAATERKHEKAFLLEGPVFSAGSVLDWLQLKGFLPSVSQLEGCCMQAQAPVQFLPALGGLGAPYWDYTTRACANRVTAHTTKADWVAGALQGVALRVADIVYYLQAQGHTLQGPLQVSGGLTHSNYLVGFEADMLQQTLQCFPDVQSTALGAARLAANYAGWQTVSWRANPVRSVSPRLTRSASQARYEAWAQFVQDARNKKLHFLL